MARVERVAVLGTGIMGAAMALNLAKSGLEVRAWNRTAERAAPLKDHGVSIAGSATAAVQDADAVLTVLTDGRAVEGVMGGGALDAMADDALWLQASTVGVRATERLSKLARGRGVAFVDCPVLGTKQPAEQGQLTVLASGPEDARERCATVFDALGKTVWLGEAGMGTRMKLVLNSWLLALVAALGETIALAGALGVDPYTFLETIDGSPLGVPYARLKGKAMIDRSYEPAFPLELAEKDATLVLEAAELAELEPQVAAAARRLFAAALEAGHARDDMAAVYEACSRDAV
jgi:3-hydroxyisobutyrate dehydrogenase